MKQAKKICANVRQDIRPQVETLARAVLALQKKLEDTMPEYESMELSQILRTVQGEPAIKANPAMQEFRATVRDYATALKNLQDIVENNQTAEKASNLADFRNKLKVVS